MVKVTKPVYTSKRLLLTLDFIAFNNVWGKNGYDLPFGATNSKTVLQLCKCPSHTHTQVGQKIFFVFAGLNRTVPQHTETMYLYRFY